jgi:hypothetical protein
MYPYLINDCYYTDTDSLFVSKELNPSIVGKKLGMFKNEYGLIKHAIFPSPKLYYLELENGSIISKQKGFKTKLSMFEYFELYNGNAISIIDER